RTDVEDSGSGLDRSRATGKSARGFTLAQHALQHLAELRQVRIAEHRLMIAGSELDHHTILRNRVPAERRLGAGNLYHVRSPEEHDLARIELLRARPQIVDAETLHMITHWLRQRESEIAVHPAECRTAPHS